MNRYGWVLSIGFVASVAVPAAAAGKKSADRYLEYRMAIERSSSLDDLLPFMTQEEAERTQRAPASVREHAWTALRDPAWRLSQVTVTHAGEFGDSSTLQVTAVAPGSGTARRGFVQMGREGGVWKVKDETWLGSDVDPRTSSPGVSKRALESAEAEEAAASDAGEADADEEPDRRAQAADDAGTRAATEDIRAFVEGEGAYQNVNLGFYDTPACLGRTGGCFPHAATVTYSFITPELASLATRSGYRRRFDPGPSSLAQNPNRTQASPSSIDRYAYWIIPDPAQPGRRARCGDGSVNICEMPDGNAPPTKGECPFGHGCRRIE